MVNTFLVLDRFFFFFLAKLNPILYGAMSFVLSIQYIVLDYLLCKYEINSIKNIFLHIMVNADTPYAIIDGEFVEVLLWVGVKITYPFFVSVIQEYVKFRHPS